MTGNAQAATSPSILAPLYRPVFFVLWWTSTVAAVGGWMQDLAGGWLMTSLMPSPLMVALMQTATYLPYFLLSLPAGTLADVVDRRLQVVGAGAWICLSALALGLFTVYGVMTPWLLLTMILSVAL